MPRPRPHPARSQPGRVVRIGSLCTGYGGLDMAARALYPDARVEWFAETNPYPATVTAHHHPNTPNLGDITVNLDRFDPVDILTAGFPCQPASVAGSRGGTDDDRWLWPYIADLIAITRPAVIMLENVPGLYTVSDGRAFAEVTHTLDRRGYRYAHGITAAGLPTGKPGAHVGAAHRRRRVFVLAVADQLPPMTDMTGLDASLNPDQVDRMFPTPAAWDGRRGPDLARADRPDSGGADLTTTVERLLPTPMARDWKGETSDNRHAPQLPDAVAKLLPTPTATDASGSRRATAHTDEWSSKTGTTLNDVAYADTFGDYAPAITRHARHHGHTTPDPRDHAGRLSPRFVEWLMMLPPGYTTDIDLDPYHQPLLFDDLDPRPERHRRALLAMLGNGVIPRQAALAYHHLATNLEN